jgi:hypothetical protein
MLTLIKMVRRMGRTITTPKKGELNDRDYKQ